MIVWSSPNHHFERVLLTLKLVCASNVVERRKVTVSAWKFAKCELTLEVIGTLEWYNQNNTFWDPLGLGGGQRKVEGVLQSPHHSLLHPLPHKHTHRHRHSTCQSPSLGVSQPQNPFNIIQGKRGRRLAILRVRLGLY